MFRSIFSTIFRGSSAVLCAVTIPPADLRSLSSYYYAVCGLMCMSSVRVWCSCLLVIFIGFKCWSDCVLKCEYCMSWIVSQGILYIYNKWYVLYIYSLHPDNGQQICPKHVEVDWRDKLTINRASRWFLLHGCIEMHGKQNIKLTKGCSL